jgi:hypothetical protein
VKSGLPNVWQTAFFTFYIDHELNEYDEFFKDAAECHELLLTTCL